MRWNWERYKKLAPEFKKTFGIRLMPDFWDHLLGFALIKFDEWLETPDGSSTKAEVRKRYGEEGVDLVLKLIGNKPDQSEGTITDHSSA